MTAARAVRLVAAREVRERLRTRSFRVATVLSAVLVAAGVAVPRLLGDDSAPRYDVGVVGAASAPLREAVARAGTEVGAEVTVAAVAEEAAAEEAVRSGELDVALVDGRMLLVGEPVEPDDPGPRAQLVRRIGEAVRLQAGLEAAGVAPGVAARALAAPPLPVRSLEGGGEAEGQGRTTGLYSAILLYTFLSLYGAWVVNGVVEEKASRVVEVLLSAVRPRHLLAGKTLGIGVVALVQALVVAAVALATAAAFGSDVLRDARPVAVASTVAWFLLGYAFYSSLYAAAGSLVTRQEDAQNVVFPLTLPLLLGYLLAFSALFGSVSPVVRALSFLPFTSPVVMPVRVAVGDAHLWEVAVAAALLLGATVLAVRFAGDVYSRAVLSGRRLKLREALSAPAA